MLEVPGSFLSIILVTLEMAIKLKNHESTVRTPGGNSCLKCQELGKLDNFIWKIPVSAEAVMPNWQRHGRALIGCCFSFSSIFLLRIKAQPKWKFCI